MASQSRLSPLIYGVPQGSVLGPVCFTMYTAPLEDVVRSSDGVELMTYADDTQLYLLINSSEKAMGKPVQQLLLLHSLSSVCTM